MTSTADEGLSRLQRRQLGLFTRADAATVGLSVDVVDQRLARGRYRRLLPGVLADAGLPDTRPTRLLAAQLWAGGDAVLARHSAADVLGIDVPREPDPTIHLLVAVRTFAPRPGIVVHRTRTPPDVVRRGPFALTAPTRTVCDLAAGLDRDALRRTLADAVRRRMTSGPEVRVELGRLGRVRGRRALARLVAELSPLARDCRSELESRFLALTTAAGIAPTAMNAPVRDVRGRRRLVDAVWVPPGLPVELDSRTAHGTLLDWHDDLRRENDIVLAGGWLPFLRFSWHDVTQRPDDVVRTLRSALDQPAAVERAVR